MLRASTFVALIGAALATTSCRTSWSEQRRAEIAKGAHMNTPSTRGSRDAQQRLRDYKVVMSAHRGKVGYIKVYDVSEGLGNTYPWSYVYDADWNELGWVDQFGGAVKYHIYSPSEAAAQNLILRGDKLPADSLENNVMRMLGIDVSTDQLTFPTATKADIVGDTDAQHLGGPGIAPSKGPVEKPKP